MSDDNFGKVSCKVLEGVVIASAAAGGTFLAGPGGGVAATASAISAIEWARARSDPDGKDLFAFRLAAVEDQCRRLDEAVRRLNDQRAKEGKTLDREEYLDREAVYSDFAKAVSSAPTPQKREALVHAAARQFDPDTGEPSVRAHWFKRVSELPDLQVRVVQLLALHARLAFNGAVFKVQVGTTPLTSARLKAFTMSDVVALEVCALEMSAGNAPAQLLARDGHDVMLDGLAGGPYKTSVFRLTPSGEQLGVFIMP